LKRRPLLARLAGVAGVLAVPTMAARAQEPHVAPRIYAVMSLVADFLTVTGFESTTGSLLAQNQTERIELQTDELERVVVRTALRALDEQGISGAVPMLSVDGRLYAQQGRFIDGDTARLPGFLLDLLQTRKVTHLLLVTKFKGAAKMRSVDLDLGTGRVEGLGFYLDRVTTLRRLEHGDTTVGYLAPHAYLRLSLIDVARGRVLQGRTLTASRVVTAAGTAAGANPWDAMSSAEKTAALSELISSATLPAWRDMLRAG
jgi:hypothetical protein